MLSLPPSKFAHAPCYLFHEIKIYGFRSGLRWHKVDKKAYEISYWNKYTLQKGTLFSIIYKKTNVMQLGNMFISNCNNALYVSEDFCVHPQEHLETVVAASGV